jgi:hypothetical protein
MRSRVRFLLTLALALLPCANAVAGPADHKYLTLRGRVADGNGNPVAGVRVQATGTRQASAVTGSDGRYQLSLDLGTLATLRDRPAAIWVRASLEGWRIVVAGGASSLAIELSVETAGAQPQLIARSNFGLIADALLDALAPPGDRTAGIQAVFTANRGAATDTLSPMAAERRATVLVEPWLAGTTAAPAAPVAPAKPSTSKSKSQSTPPATHAPAPATKSAGPPLPSAAARDSARRAHEADEKAKAAQLAAARESTWYAQRAVAQAQKSRQDSLRTIKDAAEDSARKSHIVSVHPSTGATATTTVAPATPAKSSTSKLAAPAKTSSSKQPVASIPPPPASHDKKKKDGVDPVQATPVRSRPSFGEMSGLSRVQPHGGPLDTIAVDVTGLPLDPNASSCGCRVKGTVELEFHHLLSSPMRVEVAVQDVPGMRDTVQLFMGSPRGFDFSRVPCGRLSIRVAAFSTRPFDVITPDEVAPFDCRDGGLRQVRIVIAPR